MENAILDISNLTIRFGGNTAVDDVSLQITPNQLVSVIGPNGAGKTTFFNMISGQYFPTAGVIRLKGKDITRNGVADRARMGIGRSFQLAAFYPNLTVLENVCLATQTLTHHSWCFWKSTRSFPEIEEQATDILAQVLLDKKAHHLADTLSHGEQRKLEIGLLLGMNPEVMLLDEPTAGMSIEDVPAILDLLENLKNQRNRTIMLVEHKMDMILRLSDQIAVLQEGKLIAFDTPAQIMENKQVQAAYLGKAYEE